MTGPVPSPRSSAPGSWRGTTTARWWRWPPTAPSTGRSAPSTCPMLPRSCNKPVQALAMVRAGLDLPDELLALACASHSGEPFHVEGVRRILALGRARRVGAADPRRLPARRRGPRGGDPAGGGRTPVQMNCSGKHAAMLATCVVNGWDTATYLAPDHPLQVASARHVRRADR